MANDLLKLVAECTTLKGMDKQIATALADIINGNTRLCIPSIRYIASHTGRSKSSVKRACRSLKQNGYITSHSQFRQDGSQSSNRYTFNHEKFTEGANPTKELAKLEHKPTSHEESVLDNSNSQCSCEAAIKSQPDFMSNRSNALNQLTSDEQDIVITRLKAKENETLQKFINEEAWDHPYVQKCIINEVKRYRKEHSKPYTHHQNHQTTLEKLTDRSWDNGFEMDDVFSAST